MDIVTRNISVQPVSYAAAMRFDVKHKYIYGNHMQKNTTFHVNSTVFNLNR